MVRCFFVHHQFNINDTLVRFVFVRHSTGSALVLLLIIFAFAVYLAIFAYNKSVLAGILILPYVLWIGYALAINYGVVLLN